MADVMTFPERIEDFLKYYSFRDEEEVYTNGSELIDLYRVKQGLDHYYKPVVHAHWIEDHGDLVCSNCGARYSDEIVFMSRDKDVCDLPRCPECGAIMDEEA